MYGEYLKEDLFLLFRTAVNFVMYAGGDGDGFISCKDPDALADIFDSWSKENGENFPRLGSAFHVDTQGCLAFVPYEHMLDGPGVDIFIRIH